MAIRRVWLGTMGPFLYDDEEHDYAIRTDGELPGGATELGELTDVVLTNPLPGQSLVFDGTNWINGYPVAEPDAPENVGLLEDGDNEEITLVGISNVGRGSSIEITVHANTQPGDLLLMLCLERDTISSDHVFDTILSAKTSSNNSSVDQWSVIKTRVYQPTDPTTFDFTASSGSTAIVILTLRAPYTIQLRSHLTSSEHPNPHVVNALIAGENELFGVAVSSCVFALTTGNTQYEYQNGDLTQITEDQFLGNRFAAAQQHIAVGGSIDGHFRHGTFANHDAANISALFVSRYIHLLTWDSVENVDGYNVYIDDGEGYIRQNTVMLTTPQFDLSYLDSGEYDTYVTSVRSGFESDPSGVLPVTIPEPEEHETDFSEYPDSQFPSDWLDRNNASGWEVNSEILESTASPDNDIALWDIGEFGDVEVLAKVRTAGNASTNRARVFVRHDGGSGWTGTSGPDMYYAGLRQGSLLEIAKIEDGSFSTLTNATFSYSANTWYWIRIRCEGTTLKVRVWADGDSEPSEWLLQASDDNLLSGYVGLGAHADKIDCDEFTVTVLQ